MTDVEKLLWMHQIATKLGALEQTPEYEFAMIDDPDLVKAVAIDMLRFDGARWDDVGPSTRVHAYGLAEVAIASFLQQLVTRSAA